MLEIMISCRDLSIRFGNFVAVDGINFAVDKGEVCILLGPNGAGKSSTIKALAGLLRPTSGKITISGHSIDSDPLKLKRSIGVLSDDLGLFDSLTIAEHLYLTSDVHRIERDTAQSRINDLVQFLDLEHSLDKFTSTCSHGTRKTTALAMALLPNPQVLLLDEPFEGIDPVISDEFCNLLVSVARRGTTILLTTHVLSIAQRIATQIVVMCDGKILWNTPILNLRNPIEQHYFQLLNVTKKDRLKWLG